MNVVRNRFICLFFTLKFMDSFPSERRNHHYHHVNNNKMWVCGPMQHILAKGSSDHHLKLGNSLRFWITHGRNAVYELMSRVKKQLVGEPGRPGSQCFLGFAVPGWWKLRMNTIPEVIYLSPYWYTANKTPQGCIKVQPFQESSPCQLACKDSSRAIPDSFSVLMSKLCWSQPCKGDLLCYLSLSTQKQSWVSRELTAQDPRTVKRTASASWMCAGCLLVTATTYFFFSVPLGSLTVARLCS